MNFKGVSLLVNGKLTAMGTAAARGTLKAALAVEGVAKKHVPVEHGKLRASGGARRSPTKPTSSEVIFTAAYAAAVHDKKGMKWKGKPRRSKIGVYWGPDGENKFLDKALTRNRDAIKKTIAAEMEREKAKK